VDVNQLVHQSMVSGDKVWYTSFFLEEHVSFAPVGARRRGSRVFCFAFEDCRSVGGMMNTGLVHFNDVFRSRIGRRSVSFASGGLIMLNARWPLC